MSKTSSQPQTVHAAEPAHTFPLDLAGYTAIGQHWSDFRVYSNDGPLVQPQQKADALQSHQWRWPKRPIIFISDPHADAEAFRASLIASGGVTQNKKSKLVLTSLGKKATFVIGGDCLDKGPSNLDLLSSVKTFMETGASIKLLAGNHDLRLLTGLLSISQAAHVGCEHMFVRMGAKVLPLFKEVFERYLAHKNWDKHIPDAQSCKQRLFPRPNWAQAFPDYAKGKLSDSAIEKEVQRLQKKMSKFDHHCEELGLDVRMVYAAAQQCQKLFLKKGGEFSWFFRKMQLAYKKGSFLFVHAGLDDAISQQIRQQGIRDLNRQFKKTLRDDLFAFYFSSLATPFRTKYRDSDPAFSGKGAKAVKHCGIHCVVHGHVNHANGQQISLHKGLLHVEGDITLDRNSRRKQGLKGIGFGATIIHPKQLIIGISADHPIVKVLTPKWHNMLNETQTGALDAT